MVKKQHWMVNITPQGLNFGLVGNLDIPSMTMGVNVGCLQVEWHAPP